jgi:type I restriction enzyme S subunit
MINMGELFANDRIYDIPMELVPLNDSEKKNAKVECGDLLFARQSLVLEGAGKCSIVMDVSPLTVFESHIIRVRLRKTEANPLFYYYYFRSPYSAVKTIVSQCAQAGIRGSDLQELEVIHPSLKSQNRLAEMLSSYDFLIEKNQKQIELLKEAAQRLYKEWFVNLRFPGHEEARCVDGVPEGWQKKKVTDLLQIRYGKDHKALEEGNIPVYGSGGIMRKVKPVLYSGQSVLIPRKGSLNNILYVEDDFWTIDTMFYSVPLVQNVAKYCYLFLSRLDMYSFNIGAAVPSMTVNILDGIDILEPSEPVLSAFEEKVGVYFAQIKNLVKQNEFASEARDRLLPKLMSGEIEL